MFVPFHVFCCGGREVGQHLRRSWKEQQRLRQACPTERAQEGERPAGGTKTFCFSDGEQAQVFAARVTDTILQFPAIWLLLKKRIVRHFESNPIFEQALFYISTNKLPHPKLVLQATCGPISVNLPCCWKEKQWNNICDGFSMRVLNRTASWDLFSFPLTPPWLNHKR